MTYNRQQLARYNRIRRFMHLKWPNLFTDVDSGLPKKPLVIGIKEEILLAHPEYTQEDAILMAGRQTITRYALPERGPGVEEWRMEHGRDRRTFQRINHSFQEDLPFFLRIYCTGLRYWIACAGIGRPRFDLNGRAPFQFVARNHADHATERLGEALKSGTNRERYLALIRQGR